MQVVRTIDIVARGVPLIQVDAAEVDHPQQRRAILNHREVDDVPRAVIDRADLDPRGPRRRRALHEEELPRRAVRVALHHHRAIAHVRQQHVGHVGVVLQQIAFGQAERRPEDLAEVGQPDLLAVDGQHDVVLIAAGKGRSGWRNDSATTRCLESVGQGRERISALSPPVHLYRTPVFRRTYHATSSRLALVRRPRAVHLGLRATTVAESSSTPSLALRSSRPPRLMSPRPTKSIGKRSRSPKIAEQDVDVLRRRDAAEQHDVAVGTDLREQRPRARFERPAIARVVEVDVAARECPHGGVRHERVRAPQPGRGRDHVNACADNRVGGIGRLREPARVGQLAAEIQAADEREQIAERRAGRRSQRGRERELRVRRQRLLRAAAAAVRGGKKKDARLDPLSKPQRSSTAPDREPGADRREQHEVALLQTARRDRVVQRERNRRGGRVAEPLDVDDDLARIDAELLGRRLDDAAVRLVRDEQIEVGRRQAVALQDAAARSPRSSGPRT